MSNRTSESFVLRNPDPLIGVILDDDDPESVCIFLSEEAADAVCSQTAIRDTLSMAGAWSDLDWDQMEQALDRIRHESQPSPPLTL